jgi:DNA polymerase-3 subunit epsilon
MEENILIADVKTTGSLKEEKKIVKISLIKLNVLTSDISVIYNSLVKEEGFEESNLVDKSNEYFKSSDIEIVDVLKAPSLNKQRSEIQSLLDQYKVTAFGTNLKLGLLKDRGFKVNELKCVQIAAASICKLAPKHNNQDYLLPTLDQAWEVLFKNVSSNGTDDKLNDIKNVAKMAYKLIKLGHIIIEINKQTIDYNNQIIKHILNAADKSVFINTHSYPLIISFLTQLIKIFNGTTNFLDRNDDEHLNTLLVFDSTDKLNAVCKLINNTIINFDATNKTQVNKGRVDSNFVLIGSENECLPIYRHNLIGNILGQDANDKTKRKKQIEVIKHNYNIFLILEKDLLKKTTSINEFMFDYVVLTDINTIPIVNHSKSKGNFNKNKVYKLKFRQKLQRRNSSNSHFLHRGKSRFIRSLNKKKSSENIITTILPNAKKIISIYDNKMLTQRDNKFHHIKFIQPMATLEYQI